jgi:putative pyruvate formate lyase activating enzyme
MNRTSDYSENRAGNGASRWDFEPACLALHRSGELSGRARALRAMMGPCRLCPRECGADRLHGEKGFCGVTGLRFDIASYGAHFGEERPLVGLNGSGTIFFSHCGLRCVFCQNWEISIAGEGMEQGAGDLAALMLDLQRSGCHNINVVTPTHYSAHILEALDMAAAGGLRLPLVWNTSGWERMEVLALLDGVVDIYMPDFKYWDGDSAAKYSAGARIYPETTARAIQEMHRQVGPARYGAGGIMQRGLIVRHLVLPEDAGGSQRIMEWIARHLPADTYVNIMAQYHPAYRAREFPELAKNVPDREYAAVVRRARALGLVNLDVREARLP